MSPLSAEKHALLREGTVIPATPLALNERRKFDERRQRALLRYYIDAGAGGVAVGMHFTQFEIRRPGIDLYEPVMQVCAGEMDRLAATRGRPLLKVAGIDGSTESAVRQAAFARDLGYDVGIVSLATFKGALHQELLHHMRRIAEILPVMGFYLLTGVGGIHLPYRFWRELVEMENVIGIKIAPFDRYGTIDVVRALYDAGREDTVTLYTGNDDSILYDLVTPFSFAAGDLSRTIHIKGGLLGQWACWTKTAVDLLGRVKEWRASGEPLPRNWLTLSAQITDANAAIFDPAHTYAGSIPGVHEILRRQGLLEGTWTLKHDEVLSPGQAGEITRVCRAYPHLTDDTFVADNLERWLSE